MGQHRKIQERKTQEPGPRKKITATAITTGLLGSGAVVISPGSAQAAPSRTVWDRLAACESSGNFSNRDTGRNGHWGGFQFSPATWRSVGGAGNPADASPAEQLKRAKILLARSGPGQWACKVGLTRANGAAQGLSILGAGSGSYKAVKAPRAGVQARKAVPKARSQPVSSSAAKAVAFARAQLGKPYVWGATGPSSFDCSGLTQAAWRAAGVSIPRTSQAQWAGLAKVARGEVQAGDLVVYYGGASHIAIYVGGGMVVEAANSRSPIRISRMDAQPVLGVVRPHGVVSQRKAPAVPKTATAGQSRKPVAKQAPRSVGPSEKRSTDGRTHTVSRGEYLMRIAREHNVRGGWPALYAVNRGQIKNPHLVYPGQVLRVPR